MNITIYRRWPKDDYTISEVYIDSKKQPYSCLEDTDRGLTQDMKPAEIAKRKIKGQTAIPRGTYRCIDTYSPKYGRKMPLLADVPGFEGIRIHAGNSNMDTEGCLIFGKNDKVGWISNSRYYTGQLTTQLREAWAKGETVTINITDQKPIS